MLRKVITIIAVISAIVIFSGSKQKMNNKNYKMSINEKVEDLLSKMTLEEKIEMLGGTGFATKPIERLGVPELKMTDGPIGVRWKKSTAFPSGIAMAASWDTTLIYEYGKFIGKETRGHGRDVILGPCVNIARLPMGGRNFESYGEDPYLDARLAVNYIKGVQSENVAATVKHFAVNNQEYERTTTNAIVDKRTLNEIYLPAFKAAVKEGNVLAVMSAYNKLNGLYCSENSDLLIKKLKDEWGFKGLVMSDWGAVHSAIPTFENGLDLEMPTGKYLNQKNLYELLKENKLSQNKLDDKIRRILTVMFKIGLFDENRNYDSTLVNNDKSKAFALKAAKAGIVLLKNDENILPISKSVKSIAVIGPNAAVARTGGGGSSKVLPYFSVSPLDGLKNELGQNINISYSPGIIMEEDVKALEPEYFYRDSLLNEKGIKGEYFKNMDLKGTPAKTVTDSQINFIWNDKGPFADFPPDSFSVRWTTYLNSPKSGAYQLLVASDDGVRLYVNDKLVIDDWNNHAVVTNSYEINMIKNKPVKIVLEYYENAGGAAVKFGWTKPNENIIQDAVKVAKENDLAIVFVGTSYSIESEGFDRKNLELPSGQENLINEIAKANKNVVVVLTTGSPVLVEGWKNNVKGIIESWFDGEEIGNAIAQVLTGKFNPSGKLPITFPKRWEDCSAFPYYMKKDNVTEYGDGIFVGYRHFDKNNIEPSYPFGYGLSYSTFAYSNMKAEINGEKVKVSFDIKNTGNVSGAEIAQIYVHDVSSTAEKAVKELKGFSKVMLEPGETKNVIVILNKDAFMYYSSKNDKWKLEPGEFTIMVGSSSRDIKLSKNVNIK